MPRKYWLKKIIVELITNEAYSMILVGEKKGEWVNVQDSFWPSTQVTDDLDYIKMLQSENPGSSVEEY